MNTAVYYGFEEFTLDLSSLFWS